MVNEISSDYIRALTFIIIIIINQGGRLVKITLEISKYVTKGTCALSNSKN